MTDEQTPGTGENTDSKNTSQPDGNKGAGSGSSEQKTEGKSSEAVFTQADVDRIVSARLAAENKKLEKKAQEKQLPEIDQLRRRAEESEAASRRVISENLVLKAVASGDFYSDDPELVFKAIQSELSFGEDGQPNNLDVVLKAAKKKHPRMFGSTQQKQETGSGKADAGTKSQPANASSMNEMFRKRLFG